MTLPNITDLERITKVFHGLLDYIGNCNDQSSEGSEGTDVPDVPDDVQSFVLKLQVAHETFEKDVTNYMHRWKRNASQVKVAEKIVEANPYYLSVKNRKGNIPIQTAAVDGSSFSTFIPFLAKAGIQHGVGGKSGRGGLAVKGSDGFPSLNNIASRGNLNTMKALQSSEPPLLEKSDIATYALIHNATVSNNLDLIKMMIGIDPSSLYPSRAGTLPIHWAKSKEAAKLLLKSAIKHDPKHNSIGGLFEKEKDNKGVMAITHMINTLGEEDTWECIENVLSTNDNIPILQKAILHAPEYIVNIVTSFPDACFIRDENGRLPIHVALETGMKWSTPLVLIMNSNLEHLGAVDPLTKLCLSALAAAEPACDLKTINYLISKYPKNAKISASDSDKGQGKSKKQKLNH